MNNGLVRWYQRFRRRLKESGGTEALDGQIHEAVDWAQRATEASDWDEAVERWASVVRQFGSDAPPKSFARLAIAYRERGDLRDEDDLERAEAVLDQGRSLFPDDVGLAVEWAQLSMVEEDWEEAVRRWELVLERFPDEVPPKVYARLAISHRELGRMGVAAVVLDRGRSLFPDDVGLAVEWAQLSMVEEDWEEAVRRWELVLERFPDEVPPKVYARLAISHREQGRMDLAAVVLDRGRSLFLDDVGLAVEWAELALVDHQWDEALSRWESVLERFEDEADAKVFARLATEYRHIGAVDRAASVIRRGRSRFPSNLRLIKEDAHLAMVQERWVEALQRWSDVVTLQSRELDGRRPRSYELPLRAPNLDWHEASWIRLARWWPAKAETLGFTPGPELFEAVAEVLRRIGASQEATGVLRLGLERYPSDRRLLFEFMVNEISIKRRRPGATVPLEELVEGLSDGASDLAGGVFENLTENSRILQELASHRPARSGLSPFHRIRIPRGSSIELQVRAGRFYTQKDADLRIRQLSEAEGWPELGDAPNPLTARARLIADRFGERFDELPHLPADVLADAVFFLVLSELFVYEPMRRLAKKIAREVAAHEPVFLEVPRGFFRYLHGYADNDLGLIYLYFELRRLGVNAYVCQFFDPDEELDRAPGQPVRSSELPAAPLHFVPSGSLMQARAATPRQDRTSNRVAVIPAGIRSVEGVLDRLDDPILYSTGFLTQKFAYDRSFRKWVAIEPEASIHPRRDLLPRVSVDMWRTATLKGRQLADGLAVSTEAPVEVSLAFEKDWPGWLDHVLHDYLVDLARRCHAEVAVRGIKEVHVSDHFFAEPAVFSGAIRAVGGRVVLWPHSANPAHLEARYAESFDKVYAVTKTGCQQWREKFPDKEVRQSASLMLQPPEIDYQLDDDEPLSVVVIGGKAVLGSMPFINLSEYEESYRQFFDGLEALQRIEAVNVYYKPKGLFGENEYWLEQIVGDAAGWRTVLEHPLRMSLPNMVYVSIAVGTSALLEGLSRGIPCLIVRDFPAWDYTTLEPGTIPMGPTEEMLEVLRGCARGGLYDLVEEQLAYYEDETGLVRVGSSDRASVS